MAQVNVDLMIGDLVIDTEFEERPRVDVVECIEPSRVWLRNGKLYTPIEFIKPIPLTAEILERNGFEKVLDKYKLPNYRIKWPSNGEYYFTIWTAVDGYWSPVGFGITLSGIPCEIDYVHQLQRALRLCGIEKEIII